MAKNAITIAPPRAAESTPTPPFMTAATADVAARAATAVVELRKRSRSHSEDVERGSATPLESDCCPPALEVMEDANRRGKKCQILKKGGCAGE
ncbi:hypothetical protein GCM10027405_04700 [Arthrobacter alkaliphilus]